MVTVFKTNVQEADASAMLVQQLLEHFPDGRISFDLEDCDRVLRIERNEVCVPTTIAILKEHGFSCEMLQ